MRTPLEPQASGQALRYSGVQPIKPIPNIGTVVAQSQQLLQNNLQPSTQPQISQNVTSSEEPQNNPESEIETTEKCSEDESFESCWNKTVDTLFSKKPAFYHQLKDYLPKYENEIITIDVENDFQRKQLEASRNSIMNFWNDQFKNKISNVEFVIHEHEKKKMIYTTEDKVRNMMEQNPELKNFLNILNFRIKD